MIAAVPTTPLPRVAAETYERRAKLGEGGMGTTWLAWDRRLGRLVALKEPRADRGDDDRELLARFEDEARLTAGLQHPAIVNVHEAGFEQADGSERLFYTMQPIDGRTLEDAIQARSTLTARLGLLPQFTAIANAVAYAHDRGIVHRDLKPANILIGNFGEAVLIDWGLAKAIDGVSGALASAVEERTWTVAGSGTLMYMAPEQAAGEPAAPAVDVYALGATLFHLIAGAPAYAELDQMQLRIQLLDAKPAPRLDVVVPEVPRELAAIVTRAMAADPAQRFASAKDLADELTRFATGQLVQSYRQSMAERFARWFRQHRLAVALGVATLAIGAAALAGWLFVGARARSIGAEQRATKLAMDVGLQTDLDRAARLGDRFGADAELAALREVATRHQATGLAAVVQRGLVALTVGEQARRVPRRGAPPVLLAPGYLALAEPLTIIRLVDGVEVARVASPDARAAAISGDGRVLAIATCASNEVLRFALPAGTALAPIKLAAGCEVGAPLRLSANGDRLAMATSRGVQVVDLQRGAVVPEASGARDVRFARDTAATLVEAPDGTLQQLGEGKPFVPIARPRAMSPDGAWLALGTDSRVWLQPARATAAPALLEGELLDLTNDTAILAIGDAGLAIASAPAWAPRPLAGPVGVVVEVARSPDGRRLATRDAAGAVVIWQIDPSTPDALVPLQRVVGTADHVAFVGAAAIAMIDDAGARVVDVVADSRWLTHGAVVKIAGNGRVLAALRSRPRGDAPTGPCATIDVFDLASVQHVGSIELPTYCDPARRMFIDDAGAHVVLATPAGSDVVEVATGRMTRLPGVDVVAVSPGGRWLVGAAAAAGGLGFGLYDATAPAAAPLPLPLVADLATASFAFEAADRAVAVTVGGQAQVVNLVAAPRISSRAGVELTALAGDGAVFAGTAGDLTWLPQADATPVQLPIQLTGAVSALAASSARIAVASARRVSAGTSIATIEVFDVATGQSLAVAETSEPVTRLYFTEAGYLIAQAGAHVDVFSAHDGARLLGAPADAIAGDLGFVVLTAGATTSVRPLIWPSPADLLAPASNHANARVCGALGRVVYALPFAATQDEACR